MKNKLAITSLVLGLVPLILIICAYVLFYLTNIDLEKIVGIDNPGGAILGIGFYLGFVAVILGLIAIKISNKQGKIIGLIGAGSGLINIFHFIIIFILASSSY